jgi:hypothetical protein
LGGGFILSVGKKLRKHERGNPLKIATFIPFSIIRKESFEIENLEALLFSGLFDVEKKII